MGRTIDYVTCSCSSFEHTIRFILDEYEDSCDLYLEVPLMPRPFFKRLWHGIKYIFGYHCKYGMYDCTMLDKEKCQQIIDLLENAKDKIHD
jgi:hypothetical protein